MKILEKNRIPLLKILIYGLWPGKLKCFFYKMLGHKIGKDVKIGFGSVILSDRIEIEDNVKISPLLVLQAEEVLIQKGAKIGSFCFFELKRLVIGKKSRIRESVNVGGWSCFSISFGGSQ
jgi:acetyltransferase-like isoleucine patch superfamily enzyme